MNRALHLCSIAAALAIPPPAAAAGPYVYESGAWGVVLSFSAAGMRSCTAVYKASPGIRYTEGFIAVPFPGSAPVSVGINQSPLFPQRPMTAREKAANAVFVEGAELGKALQSKRLTVSMMIVAPFPVPRNVDIDLNGAPPALDYARQCPMPSTAPPPSQATTTDPTSGPSPPSAPPASQAADPTAAAPTSDASSPPAFPLTTDRGGICFPEVAQRMQARNIAMASMLELCQKSAIPWATQAAGMVVGDVGNWSITRSVDAVGKATCKAVYKTNTAIQLFRPFGIRVPLNGSNAASVTVRYGELAPETRAVKDTEQKANTLILDTNEVKKAYTNSRVRISAPPAMNADIDVRGIEAPLKYTDQCEAIGPRCSPELIRRMTAKGLDIAVVKELCQ